MTHKNIFFTAKMLFSVLAVFYVLKFFYSESKSCIFGSNYSSEMSVKYFWLTNKLCYICNRFRGVA